MTIRDELDQLIDWYERHSYIVGRVIPVAASARTVAKFALKRRLGPYVYRDCEIVPIGRLRRREDKPKNQTELIV